MKHIQSILCWMGWHPESNTPAHSAWRVDESPFKVTWAGWQCESCKRWIELVRF